MIKSLPGRCLAPSILSADFSKLKEEIDRVSPFSGIIHVDVMDNHFVPNLTIGPPVAASLSKVAKLPLDCHLMVENPETLVRPFAKAGAKMLSVHIEASVHMNRLIDSIRSEGLYPGVALNPATPLSAIEEVLADLDFVLIMSVNPGFGGQSFIKGSVPKIKRLKAMISEKGLKTKIEVDGGVCKENIKILRDAGVDWFVAGSAVFSAKSPAGAAKELAELIDG
jgi:ribulose-phosphate 3-epimerase